MHIINDCRRELHDIEKWIYSKLSNIVFVDKDVSLWATPSLIWSEAISLIQWLWSEAISKIIKAFDASNLWEIDLQCFVLKNLINDFLHTCEQEGLSKYYCLFILMWKVPKQLGSQHNVLITINRLIDVLICYAFIYNTQIILWMWTLLHYPLALPRSMWP